MTEILDLIMLQENGANAKVQLYLADNLGNLALQETLTAHYDGDGAFGSFINTIGDINNDGPIDIAISASSTNYRGTDNEGVVYIYLGQRNDDGNPIGFKATNFLFKNSRLGETPDGGGRFGTHIVGVGDINNDGIDDFAIGSPSADLELTLLEGENVFPGFNSVTTPLPDNAGDVGWADNGLVYFIMKSKFNNRGNRGHKL